MDKRPLLSGVHVVLGDSAGGTFRKAFPEREQLLIDQDVLSCGPTPECRDLARWQQVRAEYWARFVPDEITRYMPSPLNLVAHSHRLRDAERICIWAATGVSEQLFVAFVLHLSRIVQADPARVSIVQFECLRNRDVPVVGTGELSEEDMSNHPAAVPLSNRTSDDYLGAWTALTNPTPALIERFSENHPDANRWLKQTMKRMLHRFPDKRSGMPCWDFSLLENARKHGPSAARIIGHTIGENWENADPVGDWYLFGRLRRMGDERLPKPLLTLSGNGQEMRGTQAAVTPFGEAVLDGRESNYPANPIEDWVAGTRLSSVEGTLWVRDGEKVIRDTHRIAPRE